MARGCFLASRCGQAAPILHWPRDFHDVCKEMRRLKPGLDAASFQNILWQFQTQPGFPLPRDKTHARSKIRELCDNLFARHVGFKHVVQKCVAVLR